MDSRLLNAFQDDHYDSSYGRYDNTEIWSTENLVLQNMELTDTLDGILPISATEADSDLCNPTYHDDHMYSKKDSVQVVNPSLLVYNDFMQQQIKAEERVGSTEADLLNHCGDMTIGVGSIDNVDAASLCSVESFRSRTDSSSIGDYESHSSDYDDDDDDEEEDVDDINDISSTDDEEGEDDTFGGDVLTGLPDINLFDGEEFMFAANGQKQRTFSTNTISSEVDALHFDLAEFITNDSVPAPAVIQPVQKQQQKQIKPVVQIISSKTEDDGSESDVIVDVETVECDEVKERAILLQNATVKIADDNLSYVDNVKKDPEWSPKEVKMKQSGKRGKNVSDLKRNEKLASKSQTLKSSENIVQPRGLGLGKGGKNLALLKRDRKSIEDEVKETETKDKNIALPKQDNHRIDPRTQNGNRETLNNSCETEKRKLNLEEYKRRYGDESSLVTNSSKINENKNISSANNKNNLKQTNAPTNPINPPTPTKNKAHSEAVTKIVQTLKEERQQQQNLNQKLDPITQAKNKVLRMQELKRAQQMKMIDSTISAKVPRVTKLLPLQEIIKDTAYAIKSEKNSNIKCKPELNNNPNYVKIVMVSVACNTALTITPADILPNVPLLGNKSQAAEHVKISNNSLITSIQDAVVKQSSIPKPNNPLNQKQQEKLAKGFSTNEQHGEDKIIMHLPKNHIRGNMRSIEIQTDYQAAFPTLPLPKLSSKFKSSKNSRRKYRSRNLSGSSSYSSSSSSSSGSSSSESDSYSSDNESDSENRKNVLMPDSEISVACNGGGTGSIGGYSSRSTRRHRSSVSSSYSESGNQRYSKSSYRKRARKHTRSSSSSSTLSDYSDRSRSRSRERTRSRSPLYKTSQNQNRRDNCFGDKNVSKPAVEERRIVYVGRIEEETTKEMLRRKFLAYGSIKQITIHYKENGMKYGFVTFDRSEDAFTAIDSSSKDSQINMYDISFGGRRAFCRTTYADLDNAGINNYHSYVFPKAAPAPKKEDSFEALLKQVKAKLDANKSTTTVNKL